MSTGHGTEKPRLHPLRAPSASRIELAQSWRSLSTSILPIHRSTTPHLPERLGTDCGESAWPRWPGKQHVAELKDVA